ncbi:MAG TPA: MerR family transcriptional regulator [Gemmatimonadaceae bacterium]
MEHESTKLYKVREFAKLAGVTVRALHHYDRLGLLTPARRTGSSYRLYSERDLARLEEIVVLKFLGIPLREIRPLLDQQSGLADALRRQQRVLSEKRRQLEQAITTIAAAERSVRSPTGPNWTLFRHVIQEIEMQNETNWQAKYYSPEAREKVEQRKALWSPELQEEVTRKWNALFADIEASLDQDPASPEAQALAARWRELLAGFTGGDPEIQKGLNKMWQDKQNWPAADRERVTVKPEIQEFIMKAMRVK